MTLVHEIFPPRLSGGRGRGRISVFDTNSREAAMSDRDIDAQFDAIVARWDDDAPQPPKPRTVQDITTAYAALSRAEPDPATQPSPDEDAVPAAPAGAGDAPAASDEPVEPVEPVEPQSWRQGPSIDAEEDHFEPGPVRLPPGEDLGYWGALIGLVGGPLLLLWVALASPFHAGWWILGGIALFLGGFGLLVLRQPAHRDPFDDDDGARV